MVNRLVAVSQCEDGRRQSACATSIMKQDLERTQLRGTDLKNGHEWEKRARGYSALDTHFHAAWNLRRLVQYGNGLSARYMPKHYAPAILWNVVKRWMIGREWWTLYHGHAPPVQKCLFFLPMFFGYFHFHAPVLPVTWLSHTRKHFGYWSCPTWCFHLRNRRIAFVFG